MHRILDVLSYQQKTMTELDPCSENFSCEIRGLELITEIAEYKLTVSLTSN